MNAIQQVWCLSEKDEFYITYFKFDNELKAINGVAFVANSNAMPYTFGSPTGELIGNISWSSLDGSAVCFQKENFGIVIFKPVNFKPDDQMKILYLSNKIIGKIMKNTPCHLQAEDANIMKQYSTITGYQEIISKCNNYLLQAGYSEYNEENTYWLVEVDSMVPGFRKQWVKNETVLGIDMSVYSNSIDAKKAAKNRGIISNAPVCILDVHDSISAAFDLELNKKQILETRKNISLIGISNNKSFQFYCFNKEGIDIEKFRHIIYNIHLQP
ncbi:MAG: hypothetical protein R6W78_03105 [Bacteroidales bacterium]